MKRSHVVALFLLIAQVIANFSYAEENAFSELLGVWSILFHFGGNSLENFHLAGTKKLIAAENNNNQF